MKRLALTLTALLMTFTSMMAMSYETAREHALYLTDKMAYELDLNEEQYEYAYEINLDYLMGLNTMDDIDGAYLSYRNADFQHILLDWQWRRFLATSYFFRPILWRSGAWYYPIYSYYRHDHWYYSRPSFYYSYRGGHGHDHYHSGYYYQRRPTWTQGMRGGDRGHVNRGYNGSNRGGRDYSGTNRGRSYNHYDGRPNTDNGRGNINRGGSTFRYSGGSERTTSQTSPSIRMDRNITNYQIQNRGTNSYSNSRSGASSYSGTRSGASSYGGSRGGASSYGGSRSGSMQSSSRGGSMQSGSRGGSMQSGRGGRR